MGQTLSEPVTTQESSCCQNERLKVGSSCMQGWRVTMEDAHTQILSMPDDPNTAFFGVYDGHGGPRIAKYASNHLHKHIVNHPYFQRGDVDDAIREGYMELDASMQEDPQLKDEFSGSTAVCCVIQGKKLYCGNAGDSRAVASVFGCARDLSHDHKPTNEEELQRIKAAGGWVELNRVNRNLALSRALGDFVFKRNNKVPAKDQIITAYPDVTCNDLTEDWEFVVLACDGIWDVMTSQEVVDFIRVRLSSQMEPEVVCEELMMACLAPDAQMGGLGCDNMTVLIIGLDKISDDGDGVAERCARPIPWLEDEDEQLITEPVDLK